MNHASVYNTKETNKRSLLSKKNVVSVGVGFKHVGGHRTDEVCVVVGVSKKVCESKLGIKNIIPKTVGCSKTDVVEVGDIKALENVDKRRPAPGGISIGHVDITAGTLGCLVTKDNEIFILSNNHVLANSNSASPGDPILQPGPFDGGNEDTDQIGVLEEFSEINFGQGGGGTGSPFLDLILQLLCQFFGICLLGGDGGEPNLIDAALALPNTPSSVTSEIISIGTPKGSAEVQLGDSIKKSGRTTELTQDMVLQEHVTVQVQYGAGKIATFEDQLVAGPMSAGGDSGSAILDENDKVVGLLFAGSEQTTIFNPIQHVLDAFGVTIVT